MSMSARYRLNDHYVASLKSDGRMFIKQKLCGENNYITLLDGTFEARSQPKTGITSLSVLKTLSIPPQAPRG